MYILSTAKIREFAEAVACLEPCSWTGKIEPDQVKILVGEHLDVWPASIFPELGEVDLALPELKDEDLVLPEFKDVDLALPELTEADLVPPEFWDDNLVLPDPSEIDLTILNPGEIDLGGLDAEPDLSGLDTSLEDMLAAMDKLPN